MKKTSPTRPLSGTDLVTTKNARTECDQDGMPRRNICHPSGQADPTHSRALQLMAAEAAKRIRRREMRESVRNMRRDRQKPENPVNEFALHTNDVVPEEEQ